MPYTPKPEAGNQAAKSTFTTEAACKVVATNNKAGSHGRANSNTASSRGKKMIPKVVMGMRCMDGSL
jgi:hypothetical protein